jgi:hypothetical protein
MHELNRSLPRAPGFLSCRAQSRHLLLLLILKIRDGKPGLADYVSCVAASTSLGMTKLVDPHVNRCRRFGQHVLKMRPQPLPRCSRSFLPKTTIAVFAPCSSNESRTDCNVRAEGISSYKVAILYGSACPIIPLRVSSRSQA